MVSRISLVLVMLSAVCAFAQEAEQPAREDVLKFFEVMRIRTTMQEVRTAAVEQAHVSLRDMVAGELPSATPQQIAELEGMVDKMISAYTIDNTIEDLIPIYQKHLTRPDLEATIAFFSSPVGQKFLDNEPLITSEALRVVNEKTGAQVASSMNAIYQRLDEMKAQSAGSKPGAGKRPAGASKPAVKKTAPAAPRTPPQ